MAKDILFNIDARDQLKKGVMDLKTSGLADYPLPNLLNIST